MNTSGQQPMWEINRKSVKYLFSMMIFFMSWNSFSQQKNTHDQIRALKTAFITERMAFTPSQAESFWPVYNVYEKRFHDVRKKRRTEIYQKIKNDWEKLSDSEAMQILERYFDLEAEEIAIQKERLHALRKVISSKEIITLRIAEEDFKTELLKKYRAGKE